MKEWRKQNREHLLDYNRKYAKEHKEERKIWHDENRGEINSKKNERYRKDNLKHRLWSIRGTSLKMGYTPPNFTEETISIAIFTQAGKCASCGDSIINKYWIDHCHITGNFRGLLCRGCNAAEGFLKTSNKCLSLAEYINKHNKGL